MALPGFTTYSSTNAFLGSSHCSTNAFLGFTTQYSVNTGNGTSRLHNPQFNKRLSGPYNSLFSKQWEWYFQASQQTVQQTFFRALQLTVQQTLGMALPSFTTQGFTTHCSANSGNGTSWLHNTGLHNSLLSKHWEWHFLASQHKASQLTAQQTLGMALPGFTTQGFTTHCSANTGNGSHRLHRLSGFHNSLFLCNGYFQPLGSGGIQWGPLGHDPHSPLAKSCPCNITM